MAFFYNKPKFATKLFNVKDVVDQLKAFNAQNEFGETTSSVNNCDASDPSRASWRKAVYDGVINTGGEPTELDFFEKALGFGGKKTQDVEATELFIKYRAAKDYNIVAQNSAQANTPGGPLTFTLLRSLHSLDGKYSNVAVGGNIYIYEQQRFAQVTGVDKTNDYAHQITIVPNDGTVVLKVDQGKKMMFNPVNFVDGYSCHIANTTWETPGYVQSIKPFRIKTGWDLPLELLRPFEEVMQFALVFDNNGKQMDSYEAYAKTKAREEFKYMKNLQWFLGEKLTNPAIVGGAGLNQKYQGFLGYYPTLRYAGGMIYDIRASDGFDLDVDYSSIMVQQDAQKKSKEFLLLHGFQFMVSLLRKNAEMFKNYSGSCTFDTFKRSGATMEDIKKLGITSYSFLNRTVHFKEVGAWSDTRGIGNGTFPHMGIMMPSMGLTDSKGRDVPPIEFFQPSGQYSSYEEIDRDMRYVNGCERLEGDIAETIMMAVHGPENHILLNPLFNS